MLAVLFGIKCKKKKKKCSRSRIMPKKVLALWVRAYTEVIVDSSISRAWTPHVIFLSDRNDPLWGYWYDLSNLTNQRVYEQLVYRNASFKEMITGSAAPALPSFPPPDYLEAWNRLTQKGPRPWRRFFVAPAPISSQFLCPRPPWPPILLSAPNQNRYAS